MNMADAINPLVAEVEAARLALQHDPLAHAVDEWLETLQVARHGAIELGWSVELTDRRAGMRQRVASCRTAIPLRLELVKREENGAKRTVEVEVRVIPHETEAFPNVLIWTRPETGTWSKVQRSDFMASLALAIATVEAAVVRRRAKQ